VRLKIEPLQGGAGFLFENSLSEEALAREFVEAVQQGCLEAMESGVLVGYKLVDVKVRLADAKLVEETSSELAFKVAGTKAFNEAVERAEPVLLEPLMDLEVVTPEEYTGDVMSDLNARKAEIGRMSSRAGDMQVIRAFVPLAKMFGYATRLRSLTQGRGIFTMEFDRYAEVDQQRMDAIIDGGGW
jgi:elongation factor G